MSRANNRINDLEELNHKLEQTIHNLHAFAGRLVGLGDKREVALMKTAGGANSPERPRAAFFNEIEGTLGKLADNIGYLDGLVNNLDSEVFGEPPPTESSKPFSGKLMPRADLGGPTNA